MAVINKGALAGLYVVISWLHSFLELGCACVRVCGLIYDASQ